MTVSGMSISQFQRLPFSCAFAFLSCHLQLRLIASASFSVCSLNFVVLPLSTRKANIFPNQRVGEHLHIRTNLQRTRELKPNLCNNKYDSKIHLRICRKSMHPIEKCFQCNFGRVSKK